MIFSNPIQKSEGEEKILNILCDLIPRERMPSDLPRNISPTTSKTFSTTNRIFSTISKIFSTSNKIFCNFFCRQLNASKKSNITYFHNLRYIVFIRKIFSITNTQSREFSKILLFIPFHVSIMPLRESLSLTDSVLII